MKPTPARALRCLGQRLAPLALLVLAAFAASAPAARAQSVRDSVQVSFFPDTYFTVTLSGAGLQCGAHIKSLHPDFASKLGGPYASYTYAPYIQYLQHMPPGDTTVTPPGMRRGYMQGSWGAGPYEGLAPSCGTFFSAAAATAASLTQWAIYTYPDGTPVAKFDTSGTGLTRGFDGTASFEAERGRKVPVASYRWTFGDGSPDETSAAPSHTYAAEGRYLVSLEVTDNDGQKDTYSRYVKATKPGLVVWAEAMDAGRTYRKDDDVPLVVYVENRSSEDVTDVRVPLALPIGTVYPDSILRYYKQPPTYKRVGAGAPRDTTIATIAPGERVSIETFMRVDGYASYRPRTRTLATGATGYAMVEGVTGKDAAGKAVPVERKCSLTPCGNTWQVAPPVRHVALRLRTTASAEATSVKAGLTINPYLNEPAFYGGYTATSTFDDVTCASGCVELIARVTDENRAPVENAEVAFNLSGMSGSAVVTTYPRGGHVCSKLRTGQAAGTPTCSPNGIVVKTAADGEARAIYAVQAVTAPVGTTVRADVRIGSTVLEEQERPLSVEPNEQLATEVSLSGYDAAYILANRQLVATGGTANTIGDYCENSVKWARDQAGVQDLPSLAKNSSIFFTNVGTSWVCDAFLGGASRLTARGKKVLDWLTGEGGVGANADLMKKAGAANLYLWSLGAFDVRNPHGLSSISFPHPKPVVVQFDGDFYEWTASALGDLLGPVTYGSGGQPIARDLTGARARLRVFEASTMRMGADATASSSYLRAHAELDEQTGGAWTSVSKTDAEYLYLPALFLGRSRSAWLADLLGIAPEALPEGATSATLGSGGTTSQGTPGADATPDAGGDAAVGGAVALEWQAGDVVTVGDTVRAEVNQVATVSTSGAATTVTFVRPLAHGYAAGATVSLLAHGTAGPPPAPMLVPNFSATARTELGWVASPDALAGTFDVEVARDSAMADVVHRETGTAAQQAALDVATLTPGRRYFWRVRGVNRLGTGPWSAVYGFDARATAVASEETAAVPDGLALAAPFPNPARGAAVVRFALPTSGQVRLSVYDVLGRERAVLVEGTRAAGRHEALVDASTFAPGLYVVRLSVSGEGVQTQRLVVVR